MMMTLLSHRRGLVQCGFATLVVGFALVGCQSASAPAPQAAVQAPTVAAQAQAPVPIPPGFEPWLERLKADALAKGISRTTVNAALNGLTPIPKVLELDRRQPEFSQTFRRYLDNAVTDKRVVDGQALLKQHAALLRQIEDKYGVPPRFIVAFWGMETNYGKGLGGYSVIGALATLAYDGRRADFFRGELFNALQIIDKGHITAPKMIGSWAGAMGQTQFMPSTFMKYAVDQDGDGRMDIWGDLPDAFASAGNYLKALGWNGNRTWGREVAIPAKFDVGLASIDTNATETVKPLSEWAALGVTQADGSPLPRQDVMGALVLPGGAKGPAFLVYDNYRAILKWNRSTSYAIAVGHLADRLIGGPGLEAVSRPEEPLKRDEVTTMQNGLKRLGLLNAEADGVVGASTRQALRAFQRKFGLAADGYASRAMYLTVVAQSGAPAP